MKSLHTLLKLAQRDLELQRRALGEQLARQTAVQDRMLGHEQSIISEQKAALRDYESTRAYGGYAVGAIAVRRALAAEQDAITQEIDRLRTLITEAHVETRKFERLIELEEARQKVQRDKREDAALNEMATMRAGRQTQR
jgi:hypothetical protein